MRIHLFISLLPAAMICVLVPGTVTAGHGTADSRADSVEAAFKERPGLPANPILGDYLRVAAHGNPSLRAAFYRWLAELERAGYAGKLPDPVIGYTYYIESVETRVGPQNQRFALRQMLPWFGKLGAEEDRSFEAAEAVWQRFEMEKLELFYRVKAAYTDYYYLGREAAITEENLELLRFWESVARAKYQVALAQHPDVIKAQVELGKLEDRLLTVREQLAPAAARLRAALDVGDSVSIPVPDSIYVEERPMERDAIMARATVDNPEIRAQLHLIESERAGARVAGRQNWPGLSVGLDYILTGPAVNPGVPDSGKDAFMVSVGATIPLWFDSNSARKREAQARVRAAEYDYADVRNRLAAAVDQVVYEYDDALRKTELYRDGLIPKANQSLGASYTSYQAGEMEFINVLDAQRQLLEFQLMFERSRCNLAIRMAQLEMLSGGDLAPDEE